MLLLRIFAVTLFLVALVAVATATGCWLKRVGRGYPKPKDERGPLEIWRDDGVL